MARFISIQKAFKQWLRWFLAKTRSQSGPAVHSPRSLYTWLSFKSESLSEEKLKWFSIILFERFENNIIYILKIKPCMASLFLCPDN